MKSGKDICQRPETFVIITTGGVGWESVILVSTE